MSWQDKLGHKIAYGVVSGIGRVFITACVALVQVRIVFDFLPKELAGVWFLFLSIGTYVAFFDLGISPTISREISFMLGRNDIDEEQRFSEIAKIIKTCLALYKVISIVAFFIGLVGGGIFLWKVAPFEYHDEIMVAWTIFSIGLAMNILGGAAFAILYGMGSVAVERTIRSITPLIGLCFIIIALHMGFGIKGLALIWVIQGCLDRIVGWIVLRRLYPKIQRNDIQASLAYVKKIAIPSLQWATMGLGSLLIFQTDNILIASLMGTGTIPLYEALTKIITIISTLSLFTVMSSTPFLSSAYAAGDFDKFRSILLRNVRYIMAFVILIGSYFAFFGDKIIELWIGSANFAGFDILWVLLVMVVLEVHHVIHASATMATGQKFFHVTAISAGVIKILLSLFLIPKLGLFGAAISTLCAQLLTNNWYAPYISLKMFKININDYFKIVVFPNAILLVSMLFISKFIKLYLPTTGNAFLDIILSLTLVGISGIIIILVIILNDKEKKLLVNKITGGLVNE